MVDIVTTMSRPPLPAAALHILLAIGPGARHGYAIMTEIVAMTGGSVRLAPGTLYTNIKRLLAGGLIEEIEDRPTAESDDDRRRYYRLTTAGRQVAASELERMQALVVGARSWLPERDG
jgi:DNA-binding PadR family transcriptional regulator